MAQEPNSKLKFHAINVGLGFFDVNDKNSKDIGGVDFLADVTVSIGQNLISASYLTGSEIGILDSSIYSFTEPSLSYGREWKIVNWFRLEGFAGLGCYIQRFEDKTIEGDQNQDKTTLSVPFRINTKFYFTKAFGMGLNTNYSINSVNNNLTLNLLFHYKFN